MDAAMERLNNGDAHALLDVAERLLKGEKMAKQPRHEDEPPDPADTAMQSQPTAQTGGPVPAHHQQTFGEKAVGLSFNPSGDPTVTKLKQLYAQIIDLCNDERGKIMERRIATQPSEGARLWSVAITEAQTAQMWAVKGATWKD